MHTKSERRFGPYHRKGEPYMIDREVDEDKMPFISDENIREIIWFCRILPLATCAITGLFYVLIGFLGDPMPPPLGYPWWMRT